MNKTKLFKIVVIGVALLSLGVLSSGAKQVALSDLQVEHVVTGWGEVGVDRSVSGAQLRIGGQAFKQGLGVHAVSITQVRLDGCGRRFTALVGVDDAMKGKGSVEFIVYGDGEELWRSGTMRGGESAKRIDVPLNDVGMLELRVSDAGNGNGQDHANWADPVISFEGNRPRVVRVSTPLSPCNRSDARAALIPYPRKVEWLPGTVDLSRYNIVLHSDAAPEWRKVADMLGEIIRMRGGRSDTKDGLSITLKLDNAVEGEEAYQIAVSESGIDISASKHAGLFYGVQTLRQLLDDNAATVPCCRITDRPAFKIRGFMHDLGRNPQDVELLKRFIDVMAQYKFNVFHMHLTDYPGYRIECKKYPELNDPKNYWQSRRPGFFYTYAQLNDIIQYCAERSIMVIPEIDMPGHSEYFKTTFGVDMQDPKGMAILSEVVSEFLDNIDLPLFHLGDLARGIEQPNGLLGQTSGG
ncbi:MAG: NPCBM/NEW2 domain-containing protein [Kiritimatiellae bacterium]|nr:NPCBM/NEW2 domain-containing protein [Kiritimatiellia bacterium]